MLKSVGVKPRTNTTDAPSVMELFRQSLALPFTCSIKKACEVVFIKSDASGQLANLAKGAGKRKIKVV